MSVVDKLRNEDYSVLKYIESTVSTLSTSIRVVDSFPYNELQKETLQVPVVAVEHTQTAEEAIELGSSGYRRNWTIDILAGSDVERDAIGHSIFQALDNSIPIKDFSGGVSGSNQPIIEYAIVEDRTMEPLHTFDEYSRLKFWRMVVRFSTVTTQANTAS